MENNLKKFLNNIEEGGYFVEITNRNEVVISDPTPYGSQVEVRIIIKDNNVSLEEREPFHKLSRRNQMYGLEHWKIQLDDFLFIAERYPEFPFKIIETVKSFWIDNLDELIKNIINIIKSDPSLKKDLTWIIENAIEGSNDEVLFDFYGIEC